MDFKKQVVKHIMSLNLSPLEKQHLISCVALEPWTKGQTSSAYVPDFTVSLEGNYDDYPLGDYWWLLFTIVLSVTAPNGTTT